MPIPIPSPGPIGGGPPVPNLTCAQARSEIASLTATVANLTRLLASTTDPVQRSDLEAGISEANEEIAVLRSQLPTLCAPPPPPPVVPIPVLVVGDGTDFSFSGARSANDSYFTITAFLSALQATQTTNPLRPVELTLAHRQQDAAQVEKTFVSTPGIPAPINNAFFTWRSSTVPAGAPNASAMTAVDLSEFRVVFLFGVQSLAEITPTAASGAPPLTPDQVQAAMQNLCLAWDGAYGEAQLWAFVQFMENGGGVFAAGDHEDLGGPMCAAMPRVRSMRRWLFSPGGAPATDGDGEVDSTSYDSSFIADQELAHPANRAVYASLGMRCAPPALGSYRHDTLQGPLEVVTDAWTNSPVDGVPFDRQSDDMPQPLNVLVTGHPIFALSGGGALAVMADHMHEGMTIDLTDFDPSSGTASQTYTHVDLETQASSTISEYPPVSGVTQAFPQILATVKTTGGHSTPSTELVHVGSLDETIPSVTYGAVSAYDGSEGGIGRIVVQSTFHHFFDINIIGDPAATDPEMQAGFTSSPVLTQLQTYWLNLVTWLANPATAAPLLMAAVDRARRSVSVRKAVSPGVAAHGAAVHDLGVVVTRLVDRHLPAPLLRDAVHHVMPVTHAQGVAKWLTETRDGQPELAAAVDRVLLNGFMGGATLHGLSYPREQRLAEHVEVVTPQVARAGMRGAARALAASGHRQVTAPLIALLGESEALQVI